MLLNLDIESRNGARDKAPQNFMESTLLGGEGPFLRRKEFKRAFEILLFLLQNVCKQCTYKFNKNEDLCTVEWGLESEISRNGI